MIRYCHLSFLTLIAIAISIDANAQESRAPSAAEIAQCDQIVHRYHEQKYPEMLAYSESRLPRCVIKKHRHPRMLLSGTQRLHASKQ